MAGTLGAAGRRGPIVGINMTPMVDVVLVLLVILMVSANYIVAKSLKVDLPKASKGVSATTPLTITLLRDGRTMMDERPADDEAITRRFKEAASSNTEASLVVSADREVPHGKVVHVIDLAQSAGVYRFAIRVETPQ